jgi:dTDP-glucose pyrophosphorylase
MKATKPTLVILAAGMGSRYGGLKQIDPIGAAGEALLDYSVYDAIRSGFGKIIFIIRGSIEKDFKNIVLKRMSASNEPIPCEIAFQELDSLLPPALAEYTAKSGRTKPWGTVHALLCAAKFIDTPFAIINADDFYGREAFAALGAHLSSSNATNGAIVPYKLEKTLSPKGTVSRGKCVIKDDYLVSVDELKAIEKGYDMDKQKSIIFNTDDNGLQQALAADTPVSMNCWGFPQSILPHFQRYFDEFLLNQGKEEKSECYIPLAVDWLIKNKLLKVNVLNAESEWFGVTYKEDKEAAQQRIAALTEAGVYPAKLWI